MATSKMKQSEEARMYQDKINGISLIYKIPYRVCELAYDAFFGAINGFEYLMIPVDCTDVFWKMKSGSLHDWLTHAAKLYKDSDDELMAMAGRD